MTVKSVADLMVLLFYAKGTTGKQNEEIRGITRIEKLMYLLLKEGGFNDVLSKEVTFEAYDFGPYSSEIYDLLESLKEMDIVNVQEEKVSNFKAIIDIYYAKAQGQIEETTGNIMEIYSLTEDRGFKIAEMLRNRVQPEELKRLEDVKVKYNAMKLDELLRYVYKTYPESAKKSKIIEEIFRIGKRSDLKPFDREEI
jgi:uncharacterized protein YqfB (UPF0267 family)